jgi:hypothetical protein
MRRDLEVVHSDACAYVCICMYAYKHNAQELGGVPF